jgi:hypothetical protein
VLYSGPTGTTPAMLRIIAGVTRCRVVHAPASRQVRAAASAALGPPLRLPGRDEASLYLRGRRESPPFVWLEFGTDVRR